MEVEVFLIPDGEEEVAVEEDTPPAPPAILEKEVNAVESENMSENPPNPVKPKDPKGENAAKKGSSILLWTEAVEEWFGW